MATFLDLLATAQATNHSHLCVGLDPEPAKFPGNWKDDPQHIFAFCSVMVDATKDVVLAYKPQIAHFAAHRAEEKLVTYVVKSPKGDAAISRKTAAALFRRGFINVAAGEHAHPTAGGRAALASYRRRHPDAAARP